MSISAHEIYKSFSVPGGTKKVLTGASIFVPDGTIACLIGPNGCGKTTLLKIVSTLALPDKGKVDGARKDISFIGSGEGGFYEALSLKDNLFFPGRMRRITEVALKERIIALCGRFGISPWLNEPLSHCSSGIKRKAAFVRAALATPRTYIIDEFSASLDETSRESVCAFLREETARGCSCLAVSHDPLDQERLGAVTYRMDNGQVKRNE